MEVAREAGLDVERFRIDLASNAIVEAFGADLEETRAAATSLPELQLRRRGRRVAVRARRPYEELARGGAGGAGAAPAARRRPDVADALRALRAHGHRGGGGRMRPPGPRRGAELWRLAAEWRVRPVRVLTGWLWEPA